MILPTSRPVRLIPAHAGKTAATCPTPPDAAAHPRTRGENGVSSIDAGSSWGSSPLTRGKHRRVETARAPRGLIPAHAGKTVLSPSAHMRMWVHPRSRRENDLTEPIMELMPGSSPLTRGKPMTMPLCPALMRLIPAHAGKTQCKSLIFCARSAHPRSRGENPVGAGPRRRGLGSSPLTRGKHLRWRGSQPGAALIPAHAGKTTTPTPAATYEPAHPRSRGENGRGGARMPVRWGSSPLTRGKRVDAVSVCVESGLIPAHAGKTPALVTMDEIWKGSSPLTRGKRGAARVADAAHGLIPAHAGKTRRRVSRPRSGRAHPRSRGENVAATVATVGNGGSSPLTRGKPRLRCPRRGQDGLIPAHAGKTNRHDYQLRRRQAHPRSRGENS